MPFEVKIHKKNYEKGEFSLKSICDFQQFLLIFNQHTEKIYHTYSFSIINPQIEFLISDNEGKFLFIKHISQNAFSIKYIDANDKKIFCNKFYEETLLKKIHSFFNSRTIELLESMKESHYENDEKNEFEDGNFCYSYNYKFDYHFLFPVALIVFYVILPIFWIFFKNESPSIYIISIPFIVVFASAIILGIIVRKNHIKESKRISITVSKHNPQITIILDGNTIVFLKSDIRELLIFGDSGLARLPHQWYSFSRIILKDNTLINIPSLLIDPFLIKKKIDMPYIQKKYREVCFIKNKSHISKNH